MKTRNYLLVLSLCAYTANSFAGDSVSFADKMYETLPRITSFEKHCVLHFQAGTELEACLDSQPDTDMYKNAKRRSREAFDKLNELALEYESMRSGYSDVWVDFCTETASNACLWDCINGWVCADD